MLEKLKRESLEITKIIEKELIKRKKEVITKDDLIDWLAKREHIIPHRWPLIGKLYTFIASDVHENHVRLKFPENFTQKKENLVKEFSMQVLTTIIVILSGKLQVPPEIEGAALSYIERFLNLYK